MLKKLMMLITIITFSCTIVFASGFSIYEQGAKATAMGGAFIALSNDVTAVFYNPAGITAQEGLHLGLGTTIIMPEFSFTGPTGLSTAKTDSKNKTFTPSTFYATYKINDDLTAGFGFYSMFGLGSEWAGDWVGRELATNSEIQTFFLNPTIAYKLSDELSVAVGFSAVLGTVTLENSILLAPSVYSESKIDGSANGYGYNLGLQYKKDQLSIGAVYRGSILMKLDDADITFSNNAGGLLPDTKVSSELELPAMFGVGVAYQFTDNLVAEFDFVQLNWSSYDKLVLKFDDPVGGAATKTNLREYDDSNSLRFGFEYSVNEQLSLRAGYLIDNHAAPDDRLEPSLPEGDRNLYCFGAGYKFSNFTIDAYYMLLMQDDRKITNSKNTILGGAVAFNGTYEGSANLFGISLGLGL